MLQVTKETHFVSIYCWRISEQLNKALAIFTVTQRKWKRKHLGVNVTKHGQDFDSAHLCCWSKTHQPEWNSFFMVWAAGKCKIKTPADPVSGRAALCLTDGILRLCPHIRDSKQVPCVLFYRVIIIPVLLRVLQKTDRKDSEGVSQICIHDTVWVVPQKLSSQWTGWA